MTEREMEEIGNITHFFTKIGVAIVELVGTLSLGDKILVHGPNTNFEQTVESMQIEHKDVQTAHSGQSVGLKTRDRVRETDKVFKIIS